MAGSPSVPRITFSSMILMLPLLAAGCAKEAPKPGAVLIPENQRLIQLGDGSRKWMGFEEINRVFTEQHAQGICGGFVDITSLAQADTSGAFVTVTEEAVEPAFEIEPFVREEQPVESPIYFPLRPVAQESLVRTLLPELSKDRLQETVQHLSSYTNRLAFSDHGKEAFSWAKAKFEEYAGARSDIRVREIPMSWCGPYMAWLNEVAPEGVRFKDCPPSVIAEIRGDGPLADEVVVLGAHGDSTNKDFYHEPHPDIAAPGADDDASGVATVLEVFRVLAQSGHRPERTIQFMIYAGEEHGLLGSQEIAKGYREAGVRVAGVIQFDMTAAPGPDQAVQFMSDNVNEPLTTFTKVLLDRYVGVPWADSGCGYRCSDHASWTMNRYASVFPFEANYERREINPRIHSPSDMTMGLDFDFSLHFAKLGLAFAVELGNEPTPSAGN